MTDQETIECLVAALKQIAFGEWRPSLSCDFEEDAREVWPARRILIMDIARAALAQYEKGQS